MECLLCEYSNHDDPQRGFEHNQKHIKTKTKKSVENSFAGCDSDVVYGIMLLIVIKFLSHCCTK